MPVYARRYIGVVVGLGLLSLAAGLTQSTLNDPMRFGFYFLIALFCSSLKLVLPGIPGNMSVFNILVLVGVLELSLGETLVMSISAAVLQSYWHSRKQPQPVQIAFNVASVALSVTSSFVVFGWMGMSPQTSHLALRLAGAAVAYFLVNTFSIAYVIALTSGKSGHELWRSSYFWTFPYYLLGASIAGAMNLVSRTWGWQVSVLVLPVVYGVFHAYKLHMIRVEQERSHAQEMAGLHLRTIEALAMAIEAKDDTTHEHLRRVQVYAHELGQELGLTEAEMKALQAASILHDIGKLAVPDFIISKPGKLTQEEFEKMKIHPVVGAEILQRVEFPYPVVPIVRHHHEKWDGAGYPDGLKGEEIPIGARILSAVDCLDALASDRQYRRALPLDKALEIVVSEAGKAFDPRVVAILQRRAAELEKMARAQSADVAPPPKLSTELKIERGAAPAAGFESTSASSSEGTATGAWDLVGSIVQARQEVSGVFHLVRDLGNSLSVDETMALLAIRLKPLIPHDAIAIYIRRGDLLAPVFVCGESNHLFGSLEIPVGQGLSGWVAENRKAIINGNPAVEPGYLNDPSKITRLRSALAVPLESPTGAATGVLTLYHLGKDAFSKDHLRILTALNPKLSAAIRNALTYTATASAATTDAATGLPNSRALFLRLDAEVSRCRRSGEKLAVLVANLEGLDQIKSRFGLAAGDKVLKHAAVKIKETCREYDGVACLGNELVFVMPGLPASAVAKKVEHLSQLVRSASVDVCGQPLLSISAGHAVYPEDGSDTDELLTAADRRMFQAAGDSPAQRVA